MAELNKLIHERARLRLLTYLATCKENEASFSELQDKLEFTSGNLSIQLKKLEAAGYVVINKTFKNNKPFTTVFITPQGREALNEYVDEMQKIINSLK